MTQAILAGFLIGIGDIALMSSINLFIGAFLFCVALECIIYFELPLYTGKIGMALKEKQWVGYFLALVFNVVGATLAVWMYTLMNPNNVDRVREAVEYKFNGQGYLALFIAGVFCNVLIHLAASTKHTIIVILCVMAFIICGFRHSIADSAYAFYSLNIGYAVSWLFVLLGNTVGAIITEFMLSFMRVDISSTSGSSSEEITEDESVSPDAIPNMLNAFGGMPTGDIIDSESTQTVEETNNGDSTESE